MWESHIYLSMIFLLIPHSFPNGHSLAPFFCIRGHIPWLPILYAPRRPLWHNSDTHWEVIPPNWPSCSVVIHCMPSVRATFLKTIAYLRKYINLQMSFVFPHNGKFVEKVEKTKSPECRCLRKRIQNVWNSPQYERPSWTHQKGSYCVNDHIFNVNDTIIDRNFMIQ